MCQQRVREGKSPAASVGTRLTLVPVSLFVYFNKQLQQKYREMDAKKNLNRRTLSNMLPTAKGTRTEQCIEHMQKLGTTVDVRDMSSFSLLSPCGKFKRKVLECFKNSLVDNMKTAKGHITDGACPFFKCSLSSS